MRQIRRFRGRLSTIIWYGLLEGFICFCFCWFCIHIHTVYTYTPPRHVSRTSHPTRAPERLFPRPRRCPPTTATSNLHTIPYDGGESTSKPLDSPHQNASSTTATVPRRSIANRHVKRRLHHIYANRKLHSSKLFR